MLFLRHGERLRRCEPGRPDSGLLTQSGIALAVVGAIAIGFGWLLAGRARHGPDGGLIVTVTLPGMVGEEGTGE